MLAAGMKPGSPEPAHRAAFLAGTRAYWRAGGCPRCIAKKGSGGSCLGWAMRGTSWCFRHAPVAVRRERRQRLLSRPATPAQLARRHARAEAQQLRQAWRRDRWHPGSTIILGDDRELAFRADLAAAGLDYDTMSDCTRDNARWRWLRAMWIGAHPGRMPSIGSVSTSRWIRLPWQRWG